MPSKSSRLSGLRGFDERPGEPEAAPRGRRRLVIDDLDGPTELPDLGRAARDLRRVLALARRLARADDVAALTADLLDAALLLTDAEQAALVARDGPANVLRGARDASGDVTAEVELAGLRSLLDGADATTREASSHLDVAVPPPLGGRLLVDAPGDPGRFGAVDRELLGALAEQGALAAEAVALRSRLGRQGRALAEADARAERLNRRLADLLERRTAELRETRARLEQIDAAEGFSNRFDEIVGRGSAMLTVLRQIDRVAETNVPVLFEGESGTGKDLLARGLHDVSDRAERPFVAENCGALPESLLESELFGHERGAFTGAERTTTGLFERADSGTLFLDEVGEMSPALQTRLLRVLQEGEVRRVGGADVRSVDVRVVTATNRSLKRMVAEGSFREDLYYRLAVITIRVPPLRERLEDVPALVAHFAERLSESGLPLRVTEDALGALCRHDWPGNVRQLQNEIRRAAALSPGLIDLAGLSPEVRDSRPEVREIVDDPFEFLGERGLRGLVAEVETRILRAVLERENGNITRAAATLGLSRMGLRKKLRRYGLYAAAEASPPATG